MLLFSKLKKFILEGNIYFNHIYMIHHINNIVKDNFVTDNFVADSSQHINLPNYVLDLPADIYYYENGQPKIWYKNGKLHRERDLPAIIEYDENRQLIFERW